MRDPEVVEGPTRPICPPSDPVSCLPHPRDVVPAPLSYQDITHCTHIGLTPHSESLGDSRLPFCACECFSQVRPADTPRAAAASTCTCGALLEMPNVLGSAGSWSFVLSNRWGCGGLAVRGDCTSSPPSPLPLPLPFKLLRRHHRARARGAARRHAMGGYYRDRDRGSDRDRRPADREESSDLRRRSGGATRCSAVTRDGGGCGMAAAAGRGCHAAARVVVALE